MKENFSGNRRKKMQEKGYYIVLLLCVIAVGVTGYLFITNAVRQNTMPESLSVPLTAETVPPESGDVQSAAAEAEDLELSEEEEKKQLEALRENVRRLAVTPVKGDVQTPYSDTELSYNETTRDWRLHSAVDIAGKGEIVVACMAGTVTEVYDDEFLGTTVAIRHDGGYETRYSNLTAMPTVKVGDVVKPGQTIGAVGDTAILESAQEPHLHFQVLLDGVPMDPAEIVKQ